MGNVYRNLLRSVHSYPKSLYLNVSKQNMHVRMKHGSLLGDGILILLNDSLEDGKLDEILGDLFSL